MSISGHTACSVSPHPVVAALVEGLAAQAAEVLDSGRGEVDQPVEEVPHPVRAEA